jgi:hypothetical protein
MAGDALRALGPMPPADVARFWLPDEASVQDGAYVAVDESVLASSPFELRYDSAGWPSIHGRGPTVALPARVRAAWPALPSALTLQARPDGHSFSLNDARGHEWLRATHAQPSADPVSGALWLRHLDLTVAPTLAEALQRPQAVGQLIGALNLSASGVGAPTRGTGASCTSPQYQFRWPTLGFRADIELTRISTLQTLRCEGCTASSTNARLALAPDARLRNVGEADVPWAPKFVNPPLPPYGGDQHPFLVFNFYRLDGDGRFAQLAASGVKHAFVATSLNCGCPSGFVLYGGCEDVYGAFTNDIYNALSPRTEVIPARGLWGRCGSVFDPDCDGQQNPATGAPDDFTWRLDLRESALAGDPARYFVEAWYVVRDDRQIDNSMGFIEVAPNKTDGTWTFPRVGNHIAGPMLTHLASQLPVAWPKLHATHSTPDARVDTLSVAEPLVGGGFRYQLYVANHEWVRTTTSGAFPNLRIESTSGIQSIAIATPQATLSEPQMRDADGDATNGWSIDASTPGQLKFRAPDQGVGQQWGTLHRYEWRSAQAPKLGFIEATAGRAAQAQTILLKALLPGGNALDVIAADGFESD